MTSIEENTAAALRFIEALGAGDVVGVAAELAPDAVAVARGSSAFSGTRSRDEVIGTVGLLAQLLPGGIAFTVLDTTAQDDRVVVSAKGTATTAAGTTYENDYCYVFWFANGRITRLHEMFDTRRADEVLLPLAGG
jgi:uncharacterized protein